MQDKIKQVLVGQSIARQHEGSSLIELLVALVILAIGLLGYIGLITSGLTINQRAYTLSQASFLAEDLVDRARANRDAISSYKVFAGQPPTSSTDCSTANCTEAQMADWDKAEWWIVVNDTLANADAQVDIDTGSNKTKVTIIISYSFALGKEGTGDNASLVELEQYTLITEI
ncbi:MAG: type IV pilus modification protein PilV [Oceanicoccus sp.]|uniref:type IV pilus modification protein PilV n=1 Tax=Oceanicoccus sp. TaxID=2691044 RepID=UPI00261813EF|nr:type IV pilus modification protein PilV [Oceanicoccus sp.]MCP3908006.1 type IV pilus modification protein PilV [Oceanicoccus sp.]